MKTKKTPKPNIKIHPTEGFFFTDYPFTELGDQPNKKAPVREIKILEYDGDKYVKIEVEGVISEIKSGYIYNDLYDLYDMKAISREVLDSYAI